ncbi:MAG: sugar ABC transporter permease [Desulfobacterales bacterium]|nr:MAG: sugar ABC transporter permease [Desulfobacterales bacterium]
MVTIRSMVNGRPAVSAKPRLSLLSRLRSRRWAAYWMILPLVVLIVGLVVYPFVYSVYLSFENKAETKFVGLQNYTKLLYYDTFWLVTGNSFRFTLTAVFFKATLGLILALILNNLPIGGQRLWRGVSLIPWVMPLALSSMGWWWIFEPTHSAINWILVQLGGSPKPWLSDPFWARVACIVTNIWYGTPFFMIMYLAGLKSIPESLYEAAQIDGARALQRFRYVTFPMLSKLIGITVMFSTIVTFANFDIVRILTRGGPRYTTHLFGTYAFNIGIEAGHLPRGSAVALFMVPVLGVAAFFILRNIARGEE